MKGSRWICGVLSVVLLLIMIPVQEAHAEVPHAMTHQGRLLDDEGAPISGSVEMTYTLYDSGSGGTVLWQDSLNVEVAESGFYTVELGGSDNPISDAVVSDGEVWLGVAINGGSELSPRVTLNSVPFALHAARASHAESGDFAASGQSCEAGESVQGIDADGNLICASAAPTTPPTPVGTVVAFAGTNAPDGWLLCDGMIISRNDYPDLFDVIGVSHGSVTGEPNSFRLPDYRGRFLRGVDEGQGRDPDADSRTAMNDGGSTGDNTGSVQGDAFANHRHGIIVDGNSGGTYGVQHGAQGSFGSPHSRYTTNSGGSETRPTNANVKWIIKY